MTLFMQFASLIQWSRSRVFEEYCSKLSIFRTKSRFPRIYLVLPMIFRTLDFLKLRIFPTNSASFQKFALDFSNLKIRKPRKTGPSQMYYLISL